MAQALDLALRGRGLTSPNPLVGAVVVRDGCRGRAGVSPARGGSARRGRGAGRGRLAGARRDALRDARALQPSRANAAVRRGHPRRGRPAGRDRRRRSRTLGCAAVEPRRFARPASRSPRAASRPTRAPPTARSSPRWSGGAPARDAQVGHDARRQDRRLRSRRAMDHRRGGAARRRTGCGARATRSSSASAPRSPTTPPSTCGCPAPWPREPLRVVVDSRARLPVTARLIGAGSPARAVVAVADAAPADRVAAPGLAGRDGTGLQDATTAAWT